MMHGFCTPYPIEIATTCDVCGFAKDAHFVLSKQDKIYRLSDFLKNNKDYPLREISQLQVVFSDKPKEKPKIISANISANN